MLISIDAKRSRDKTMPHVSTSRKSTSQSAQILGLVNGTANVRLVLSQRKSKSENKFEVDR